MTFSSMLIADGVVGISSSTFSSTCDSFDGDDAFSLSSDPMLVTDGVEPEDEKESLSKSIQKVELEHVNRA